MKHILGISLRVITDELNNICMYYLNNTPLWSFSISEVLMSFIRDLNRLVMDYLVIEGYKSAAEEFSLEAGVQPAVDFASIESRRNIREALNRGDVQEAITRVNDLNPEVSKLSSRLNRYSLGLNSACTTLSPSRAVMIMLNLQSSK